MQSSLFIVLLLFITNFLVYSKPTICSRMLQREFICDLSVSSGIVLIPDLLDLTISVPCILSEMFFLPDLYMASLVPWMYSSPSGSSWNVYNSVSSNQWQLVDLRRYAVFSVQDCLRQLLKWISLIILPQLEPYITNYHYMISNMQSKYKLPIHTTVTIINDT